MYNGGKREEKKEREEKPEMERGQKDMKVEAGIV